MTPTPTPTFTRTPAPTPIPTSTPTPTAPARPDLVKVAIPDGVITELPGTGNLLAWTVDDGSSSEVIRKYAEFARDTGTRLTLFANGAYEGWAENADLLRPLVATGQIQLGNHTFDHVDLTEASDDEVIEQLQKNHDFLVDTFGVDVRPDFRPPYGFHNHRTDHLAASIGYTAPVLWYGSLSDSGLITSEQLVGFAETWFLPQHIVIGHLNFTPVTEVFPQLLEIIRSRGLQTVTLDDVFLKP
ncbi:polysaccharide deacetylase [Subtercola boreus]|uniref:Polysaccharide deacetylase n=2 Tax=Subtercola boreus TaxID=120213 RepID=A0A3E0WDP7_9MICO|nr:polysaccharide deacetylase [Subtercola boreus]RFA21978.1 polysaccharide deacetylase [Subtercola boreus]RFA27924.1 polysaccharide deacetylase [Subtercola boreus]